MKAVAPPKKRPAPSHSVHVVGQKEEDSPCRGDIEASETPPTHGQGDEAPEPPLTQGQGDEAPEPPLTHGQGDEAPELPCT